MTGHSLPTPNRLLFVADGRSPIARTWIAHFVASGYEVHLASTFACDAAGLGVASLHVVPAAFGGRAGTGARRPRASTRRPNAITRAVGRARVALFPAVFGWLAPLDLAPHVRHLHEIVRQVNPALVHAMRVPYEGILAALALEGTTRPLVVSTWGNDLELWAARYPAIARLTRRALARADALHADCGRDLRLAATWGWNAARPGVVLPGNGGVRTDIFHDGAADPLVLTCHGLPRSAPLVVNARGFRSYVRNDTFFQAIPLVLEQHPDAMFAAVGMQDHPEALRWIRALNIARSVQLLPALAAHEMAALFGASCASVSPSEYDGTPNTLLEAMACGCLPIAGNIASVREWVDDGHNGLLVDPASPRALAAAVVRALGDAALRAAAAVRNRAIIAERAEFGAGMRRAAALYADAVSAAERGTRPVPTPGRVTGAAVAGC